MKFFIFIVAISCRSLFSISLSSEETKQIADKIWKSECGGTIAGLTHWGKGEGFGSFGIGHFIWYAEGKKERFEETFPALVQFLYKEKAALPAWLQEGTPCPWKTREEFYLDINTPKMTELRKMLVATRGLQIAFIVDRLEKALLQLKTDNVALERVSALTQSVKGTYAIIDYVNFKGTGLSPEESYKGQGWGLLQVLSRMQSTADPLAEFVSSAKQILQERVCNAPTDREEEKWLPGWYNRINSYLD